MTNAPATGTWHADPSHFRPSRRDFLAVGVLGGLGLSLSDVLRSEARAELSARRPVGTAKSVIHISLSGGMAHQESFDPKPDAPLEYRGELETVATSLPGVQFSQYFKRTAALADKMTVIRSLTHTEAEHQRGEHSMLTGYRPSPALVYPSMASVIAKELGSRNELPPYICVPNPPSVYSGAGFLGSSYSPFSIGSDPGRRGFKVRDVTLPDSMDVERFQSRRRLRDLVDAHFADRERSGQLDAMDAFSEQAYNLISSSTSRAAFDLDAEPDDLKRTYGTRGLGPRLLLARRLVEAGVRFISLSLSGWDSHIYHFRRVGYLAPNLDQGLSSLIEDLDSRGLLDSTLILVTTEFGRTPKVNSGAGRDHWPRVFSIAMAGGGVKRGYVHGASDRIAAEPAEKPVTVEDYAATVYKLVGLDPSQDLIAPGNRPVPLVNRGQIVDDVLA